MLTSVARWMEQLRLSFAYHERPCFADYQGGAIVEMADVADIFVGHILLENDPRSYSISIENRECAAFRPNPQLLFGISAQTDYTFVQQSIGDRILNNIWVRDIKNALLKRRKPEAAFPIFQDERYGTARKIGFQFFHGRVFQQDGTAPCAQPQLLPGLFEKNILIPFLQVFEGTQKPAGVAFEKIQALIGSHDYGVARHNGPNGLGHCWHRGQCLKTIGPNQPKIPRSAPDFIRTLWPGYHHAIFCKSLFQLLLFNVNQDGFINATIDDPAICLLEQFDCQPFDVAMFQELKSA